MHQILQEKIHQKYRELIKARVKPAIIVVGRDEAILLEDQRTFLLMEIIIDQYTKSRIDIYGKEVG